MEFVAFVGKDKENWGQVKGLINRLQNESIMIVRDKSVEGFPVSSNMQVVSIDSSKPILELKDELMHLLKPRLSGDFEVSLSLASGSGKEHMALISALLSIPVGIRLAVFTKDGIEYIN